MGSYFSTSMLIKVAFGRPYVDVFGVTDEESDQADKQGVERQVEKNEEGKNGNEENEVCAENENPQPESPRPTLRVRVPKEAVKVVQVGDL